MRAGTMGTASLMLLWAGLTAHLSSQFASRVSSRLCGRRNSGGSERLTNLSRAEAQLQRHASYHGPLLSDLGV